MLPLVVKENWYSCHLTFRGNNVALTKEQINQASLVVQTYCIFASESNKILPVAKKSNKNDYSFSPF